MLPSATRIPPPPLLELSLPYLPLLTDNERPFTLGIKGDLDTVHTDAYAVIPKPHTSTSYPVITTNSSALRRLVDLHHQMHTEMEDDLARIRLAIGQTAEEIKQLRAQRTLRKTEERTWNDL